MRGASRRTLVSILALRVSCLTGAGALVSVTLGYLSAVVALGHGTLRRASTQSLVVSAAIGIAAGLLAVGTALFVTGLRAIDLASRQTDCPMAHIAPQNPTALS